MRFEDAVAEVVADLTVDGPVGEAAVSRGLSLAVAAWTALADVDARGGWDLFGLDVCAATEAIHFALPAAPLIEWSATDRRPTRRTAACLVEAIAASLEVQADRPLLTQLEVHAAAAQLRRASDALT